LENKGKFADLHLHTFYSDGTFSPEELVLKSKKAGLCAIAVVDHDTVAGIQPAIEAAAERWIEVLPGIELSSEYEGAEVHILGYLIDCGNPDLLQRLELLRKARLERVRKITDKLQALGVAIGPESVFELSRGGTVGRLHIARALFNQGKVSSIAEAFKKYIGDKGPAYVLGFKFSAQEAIALIKNCGGVPVLAHPYLIKDDALILKFIAYGIQGLEVYYPEHSQSMVNFYLALAKKHNLLVTGGSDFHGHAKPEVKIGSQKISYALVEKLKQAQRCRK